MSSSLKIWCHRMVSAGLQNAVIAALGRDHSILTDPQEPVHSQPDVVFGLPDAAVALASPTVRWVQVAAAGYTAFDRPDVIRQLQSRGTAVTTSSAVYADPCAQHVLGSILATTRPLYASQQHQLTDRSWQIQQMRSQGRVLTGSTIVLLGFGAIGERLGQLLSPFDVSLFAYRRKRVASKGISFVDAEGLDAILPKADHVVNLLPLNDATAGFMNAQRLHRLRDGAVFHNIGRGATVDQAALLEILRRGRIRACLDVFVDEPLPPDHPLWKLPNCHVTPHAAGGTADEEARLARHFVDNLARFERGAPLVNRVI